MPLELGPFVVAGEIFNRRHNSTHGWLALRDSDRPLLFQLTGNPSPDLAGKRLRFSIPEDRPPVIPLPEVDFERLSWQQIGPTGQMTVFPADSAEHPVCRLHLEWFSQNGHVVLKLIDPVLEWVENDDEDEANEDAIADQSSTDSLAADLGLGLPDDDEDDPYGLFPEGLDEQLTEGDEGALGEEVPYDDEHLSGPREKRSWDEVIPGIDPETRRMYEEWDEVTEGTADVPLSEVFDPPIKLYSAEQLAKLEDPAVDEALKELLKRLALLGVALNICEHYSPQQAYRYLTEEILPEYGVHPRLPQIGWVQHYDTSEGCTECQAEFDRQWAEEHPEEAPADGDDELPED